MTTWLLGGYCLVLVLKKIEVLYIAFLRNICNAVSCFGLSLIVLNTQALIFCLFYGNTMEDCMVAMKF